MSFRRSAGAAAALLCAVMLLLACGDDASKKELSNGTAAHLKSKLQEVEQRVDDQDCSGASQVAASFRSDVDGLPRRVDGDLRQALASSAARLETLIADQCKTDTAPVQQGTTGTTGTTSEEQTTTDEPRNDEDQTGNGKQDKAKKPKKEKPNKNEPPADTGGAGQEDQGLDEQGGGTVPPGQG